MALDFPSSPTIGQKYPQPPVGGQPIYTWDGEKWTTSTGGAVGGKTPVFTDGSTPMTAPLTVVDPPTAPTNAASKAYVDTRVRYDTAQGLTSPQQAQARSNIFAAPLDALAFNGMQYNGPLEIDQSQTGGFNPAIGVETHVQDGVNVKVSHSSAIGNLGVYPGGQAMGNALNGFRSNVGTWTSTAVVFGVNDYFYFRFPIEGYRFARCQFGLSIAKPVTVALQIYSYAANVKASIALQNGSGNRTYTQLVNLPLVGWNYVTVTFPGDVAGTWGTTNGVGAWVYVVGTCGTANQGVANQWNADGKFGAPGQTDIIGPPGNFGVTGLLVLPGIDVPTAAQHPVIVRPYDQEFTLCQRYYAKSNLPTTAPGVANNSAGAGVFEVVSPVANGQNYGYVNFQVRQRGAATITLYGMLTGAPGKVQDGSGVETLAAVNLGSDRGFGVVNNTGASISPGFNTIFCHWTADLRF